MKFVSYFRIKLSDIVKHQDEDIFIKNTYRSRTIKLGNTRQYPLTRDTRLSDLAGRLGDEYASPRRYRPQSDEVYYDIDWFKR